jgi:hypothetical protein
MQNKTLIYGDIILSIMIDFDAIQHERGKRLLADTVQSTHKPGKVENEKMDQTDSKTQQADLRTADGLISSITTCSTFLTVKIGFNVMKNPAAGTSQSTLSNVLRKSAINNYPCPVIVPVKSCSLSSSQLKKNKKREALVNI